MFRRMMTSKRLFTWLFIISFVSVYIVMFYGLELLQKYKDIDSNLNAVNYREAYTYVLEYNPNVTNIKSGNLAGFGMGNICYEVEIPVGDSSLTLHQVHLIWEQNEALQEKINYTINEQSDDLIDYPSCILGDYWKNKVIEEDGYKYISILGKNYRVVGFFEPVVFENSDDRCFILGDSLSFEEKTEFISYEWICQFIYLSAEKRGVQTEFAEWLRQFSKTENISDISAYADMYFYYKSTVSLYAGIAQIVFGVIGIFCVVNAGFLAYVWGKRHQYEFMIKRIYGYKKIKLVVEMLSEIAIYKVFSVLIAFVLSVVYEAIGGNVGNWFRALINGFVYVAIVFIGFIIVLTALSSLTIINMPPVNVFKTAE